MTYNSNSRKKTLLISMLAFLLVGGSIFLFFVVQGADELTGKNKNKSFSYGDAAREGVSSFFKSVGILPEEEKKLSDSAVSRLDTRGLPLSDLGLGGAKTDISDWMAKDGSRTSASASASRPSAPANIAKMAQKPLSGVGGSGGAGSKSSAGLSRFGEGSGSGEASVSASAGAGKAGTTDKGTMASLKNARALLSQGLQSGSAMTAKDKWNQSFGAGGAKTANGGQLAYNKSGMVSLDKIKSGEIESLKMDKANTFGAPDVPKMEKAAGANEIDQDTKKKEDMKAEMNKQIMEGAIKSMGDAMEKSMKDRPGDPAADRADSSRPPDAVMNASENVTCEKGCTTGSGAKYTDAARVFTQNGDGNWECDINGTQVDPGPPETTISYTDTITYKPDGTVMDITSIENPVK
ncbi:MAG: hypothetical protein M0011_11085 [Elusimicrobia bacterium]|nr:hypothetical protein [Elusimicrobiota bacterium]